MNKFNTPAAIVRYETRMALLESGAFDVDSFFTRSDLKLFEAFKKENHRLLNEDAGAAAPAESPSPPASPAGSGEASNDLKKIAQKKLEDFLLKNSNKVILWILKGLKFVLGGATKLHKGAFLKPLSRIAKWILKKILPNELVDAGVDVLVNFFTAFSVFHLAEKTVDVAIDIISEEKPENLEKTTREILKKQKPEPLPDKISYKGSGTSGAVEKLNIEEIANHINKNKNADHFVWIPGWKEWKSWEKVPEIVRLVSPEESESASAPAGGDAPPGKGKGKGEDASAPGGGPPAASDDPQVKKTLESRARRKSQNESITSLKKEIMLLEVLIDK